MIVCILKSGMRIVKIEEISYEEIIDVLNKSGLVILPFDTCYGISCNPTDQKAVDKLLSYKARREGKAISIAVSDIAMARKFVEINETAQNVYDRFLPGPYTVISKSSGKVAEGIAAENNTLGVRIPDKQWIIDLVSTYNHPITSTSANQSYQKTPYKINDILDNASKKSLELVDLVIDAGELPYNPPSTVLDTTLGDVQVVRKGKFLPENAKINEVTTNSESETISFGKEMFEQFSTNLEFRPLVFALQGDLGAGKTQFTKGLAQSMQIDEPIISPTFILAREYDSPQGNKLIHIDTWRLENDEDFEGLGIKDMLLSDDDFKHNVLSIEWADKVSDYLRKLDTNLKVIWIEITADTKDENKRSIKWSE